MFEVKNQMVDIPFNFHSRYTCNKCDCVENKNRNMYMCEILIKGRNYPMRKFVTGVFKNKLVFF